MPNQLSQKSVFNTSDNFPLTVIYFVFCSLCWPSRANGPIDALIYATGIMHVLACHVTVDFATSRD